MKTATILLVICALNFDKIAVIQSAPNIDVKWIGFKLKFNKQYKTGEETTRRKIFENNLEFIKNHNFKFAKGLEKYTLGVNQFADLTEDEFKRTHMMITQPKFNISSFHGQIFSSKDINGYIPESVDWRAEGIMTPVKDQGFCGSCWAFASTGALEARWNLVNKEIKILSEQELVDCVYDYNGCLGGEPTAAYNYIETKGIEEESSYPYEGAYGSCQHDKSKVVLTLKSDGFVDEKEPNRELVLASLVANDGPAAVGIKMPENLVKKFMFYNGKYIFDDEECENVSPSDANHAVTVAGYGTENGEEFWLLKNSWGKSWGDKGYFKLKRNANNYCAIGDWIYYPVLK